MSATTTVKPPEYLNSGDSDASPNGTPSQFLLIRGLEPTVTEDLLAKGVAKLYKPTRRSSPPESSGSKKTNAKIASTTGDSNLGAKEGSLRRVLLVRDRHSNESWRYGFAEFGTVEVSLRREFAYHSPLMILSGCSSCFGSLQFLREVHDLLKACHRRLCPCWCVRSCFQLG